MKTQECLLLINGLIIKCSVMEDGKHIPDEILSLHQIMQQVKSTKVTDKKNKKRKLSDSQATNKSAYSHRYLPKRRLSLPVITPTFPITSSTRKNDSIILETENDYRTISKEKRYEGKSNGKFKELVTWNETSDYVTMETIKSIDELRSLLETILQVDKPFSVNIREIEDSTLTLTYQVMETFTSEFMILPIRHKFCLFLQPF